MLLYHGKQLFGKSVDNSSLLGQTVLAIMLICLNGGPKFVTKLIPISKLTSAILFEQTELTVQAITFEPTLPEKPWLTDDNKHLLFDYIHLLKNIRYLWWTEKPGELIFDDDGVR